MSEHTPDIDDVRAFAYTAFSQLEGFLIAGTIYMGDRLGLYKALADIRAPVSAEELADATGLHPRWVLEWLRAQGAAGLLDHAGDERFELSPAGGEVLANESSLFSAAGAFRHLPERAAQFDEITEAFRTGIGPSFDDRGPEDAERVEVMFANWYRQMLVPVALPALDGVVPKLEAGGKVADVGCGAGVALIEIARAFPDAELHGYELSEHALERAHANAAEAGVDNVEFHHVEDEPLPEDGSFDLVMTLDCIHDMTRPEAAIEAIAKALDPAGTWLWGEPKAFPTFEENVANNPLVAMMYATSLVGCMAAGLSEPGGAGLGTLGIPEPKARAMAETAGFRRFDVHDFGSPINVFYEVGS